MDGCNRLVGGLRLVVGCSLLLGFLGGMVGASVGILVVLSPLSLLSICYTSPIILYQFISIILFIFIILYSLEILYYSRIRYNYNAKINLIIEQSLEVLLNRLLDRIICLIIVENSGLLEFLRINHS